MFRGNSYPEELSCFCNYSNIRGNYMDGFVQRE